MSASKALATSVGSVQDGWASTHFDDLVGVDHDDVLDLLAEDLGDLAGLRSRDEVAVVGARRRG